MKAWQKRITSALLFPRGEKSEPPFAPPIGRVVKAFLKVCSKARNFKMESVTERWKRNPPLYGPIALLCWIRYPMLVCTFPLSSTHVTRNSTSRSGIQSRSIRFAFSNSGCLLYSSSMVPSIWLTAWMYSGSFGNLTFSFSKTSLAFIRFTFFWLPIKELMLF